MLRRAGYSLSYFSRRGQGLNEKIIAPGFKKKIGWLPESLVPKQTIRYEKT